MQMNNLQFEIQNEQDARLVAAVEGFMIAFFAIISALLLPQLIFQFLIQNPDFNPAQSSLLTNLPAIGYGVATFFVLYALLGNFLRARRIRQLKQDLELMQFAFDEEVVEDNAALAEALASAETVSTSSKKPAASETKRTPRRSTSDKKSTTKKTTKRRSTKKTE